MNLPELQSPAEHMVAAIAAEIHDGDVLLEGIGTFLPTSAYLLAQATHAPRAIRLCPVGNVFVPEAHQLGLTGYEREVQARAIHRFDYWDVIGSFLPGFVTGRRGAWKEFMRPAQVDSTGRTNNVVIGSMEQPKVRLPGAAGLPDGVPAEPALYMYVPRHNRKTFVKKLDFVSAPGLLEGAKPHMIVTDLAVMRFAVDGVLEVQTLMPGATREQVQDETEFQLRFRNELKAHRPLDANQLRVLRDEVDPMSLRDLELFPAQGRLARIKALVAKEPSYVELRKKLASLLSS